MNKKLTSAAIGGAFAATLIAGGAVAADNPFGMTQLDQGYQVAMSDKADEGKCGESKCGANKARKDGKCGESKCGANKARKDGKCGESKCGANK